MCSYSEMSVSWREATGENQAPRERLPRQLAALLRPLLEGGKNPYESQENLKEKEAIGVILGRCAVRVAEKGDRRERNAFAKVRELLMGLRRSQTGLTKTEGKRTELYETKKRVTERELVTMRRKRFGASRIDLIGGIANLWVHPVNQRSSHRALIRGSR